MNITNKQTVSFTAGRSRHGHIFHYSHRESYTLQMNVILNLDVTGRGSSARSIYPKTKKHIFRPDSYRRY